VNLRRLWPAAHSFCKISVAFQRPGRHRICAGHALPPCILAALAPEHQSVFPAAPAAPV